MTSYEGEASLILESGQEFAVMARLSKSIIGGRTVWNGTLSVPAQSQPAVMTNLQQGLVRVDGREGAFIRPNVSDWLGSPPGQFRIEIDGNGDAPF